VLYLKSPPRRRIVAWSRTIGSIQPARHSVPFKRGTEGTVLDSTLAFVSGARVTIAELQIGMTRVTESNRAGKFSIDPAGTFNYETRPGRNRLWTLQSNCLSIRAGERQSIVIFLELEPVSSAVPPTAQCCGVLNPTRFTRNRDWRCNNAR
jgi:hypothetical protein